MVVLLKALITIIVGQTLFFKFSGAAESMYIFSQLGAEPWGRIGLGVLELIAIVLLWLPNTSLYAVFLIIGMMLGALLSHVFVLGIEVLNDGGKLFFLAVITLASALVLAYFQREEVKLFVSTFVSKR